MFDLSTVSRQYLGCLSAVSSAVSRLYLGCLPVSRLSLDYRRACTDSACHTMTICRRPAPPSLSSSLSLQAATHPLTFSLSSSLGTFLVARADVAFRREASAAAL